MIFMNLRIAPDPNRTEELVHALRLQMVRTQVRPGCIQCRITQDADEENIVHYHEEWRSWDDLEKHICSERFSRILELMEHSSNPPDLIFCDVAETRGMEYVRQLRTLKEAN